MCTMYKVFINDKPLILTSEVSKNFSSGFKNKIISFKSKASVDEAIEIINSSSEFEQVILFGNDLGKLWKSFCKNYTLLEAAGGVVINEKKELLMIWRYDKWDLPKGKIEKNENRDAAALREVCEETGVCDLKIVKELAHSFHTFYKNQKPFLKKTFWFEMQCRSFSGFKLQKEEGIEDAKWMNSAVIKDAMKNTYASIRELFSL